MVHASIFAGHCTDSVPTVLSPWTSPPQPLAANINNVAMNENAKPSLVDRIEFVMRISSAQSTLQVLRPHRARDNDWMKRGEAGVRTPRGGSNRHGRR